MSIALKRVYEPPHASDGTRVLVERLWPRGITKEKAAVDHWLKDVAPSAVLRKWFGHDPEKWNEFRAQYHAELEENREAVQELLTLVRREKITFVFASREERYNNAVALMDYVNGQLDDPEDAEK